MRIDGDKQIDSTLQFFLAQAMTIKELFTEDVDITITSKEEVLEHILSKDIQVESSKGRTLNAGEPIVEVLRKNKKEIMYIPKEFYGTPFTAIMVPIRNEQGVVVGGIGISKSTSKQTILKDVAEKFAASSEEIAASTEQLTSSTSNFNAYMTQLAQAQHEMSKQVEATTQILQMINNVAKNTRVLGFNAGIEAARAGEYGRGFGVVAKEITRLADQSAQSVNEIKQVIDELNNRVDNVATIVNETLQISETQSVNIDGITASIQQLTAGAEEIEMMSKNI